MQNEKYIPSNLASVQNPRIKINYVFAGSKTEIFDNEGMATKIRLSQYGAGLKMPKKHNFQE